ncbi:hypothetical protein AAFF_G00320940 [Aldrovandia affinis]|uniref:Structure-specific endonuclease subunit SLX4 n=1 Tax=Aldrovandia affinis TaxID=143900 RepID=A0AAD7VZL3_9TELE|nr:hypothetical protein AAFF_G00320940 [Aldrovandia affinis]
MEDPPMAFDESWDLPGERPLCFSLRLDSSAGDSQSEQGPVETMPPPQPPYTSLLDSKMVRPVALITPMATQPRTPVASHKGGRGLLVPITPMPGYSDMDTPELKNRLNRFGVRPLPKRQMVLKLKEIHQYTHQLQSSESEGEGPAPSSTPATRPPSKGSQHKGAGPEEAGAGPEEAGAGLSASQGSTASSTDSERSNPELCGPSGSDDSAGEEVSASQALSRGAERLQAVRRFILSDPDLYGRVLRYEPLVLSRLQARLKAHGIRLGAAKLLDFLDSQCITCTTAKPAKPANQGPARGRGRGRGGGDRRRRRRRGGGRGSD